MAEENKKFLTISHLKQLLSSLKQRFTAIENKLEKKSNISDLAEVATTGSYNDLIDKPSGADWDASEGKDGYVKNRPLYKEKNYIELINDTYYIINHLAESSEIGHPEWVGWYFGLIELPYITLNNNEIYKVIFNGTEYFMPANKVVEDIYIIGSLSDWEGTETDPSNFEYPFFILTDENSDATRIQFLTQDSTMTEITLSVYKNDFIYHKLDSNYLDTENIIATHDYVDNALLDKVNSSDLATVATSGSYNDLSNKPVIPTVPTNVSDFNNDAGYQTASDVSTSISTALSSVLSYKGTVATVNALPSSNNKIGDVYHVTANGSEYAWNGSVWEELGSSVDLTGYATETWVENQGYLTQHQDISNKQDKLTFDLTPTSGSTNPVTSNGVYQALNNVPTGANWDASEGEDGYIQNRPFYSETSYVEIFSDTYSVNWTSRWMPTGWYQTSLNTPIIDIKEGLTYKIIVNEVEYTSIAEFDKGVCTIGYSHDETPISDFAELSCPFIIGGGRIIIYTQDNTISELSFDIYEYTTIYHKIDSNFIDIDWEASEGKQGYIKNKPFYKEISSQEYIAEEQTVSLVEEYGVGVATLTSVSGFEGLIDGEVITVTIDGDEYSLTVVKENDNYQWANFNNHSGIYYDSGTLGYWDEYSQGSTITISISRNVYIYHKLDSNYIDTENTIATHTYVNNALATKVNSADLATVATTGDYDDLSNKPTIPTVPTNISSFTNDAGYLTSHQSLTGYATEQWVGQQGYLTSYTETDPTVPAWAKASTKPSYTASEVGALPSTTVIPTKVSDLTNDVGYMTGMVILSYGTSTWSDFIEAYTSKKIVYCLASSNTNPAIASQTMRLAFMSNVNDVTNPTGVEFQYYRSVSSHSNNQQGDQVYVYKLTQTSGWSVTVRENYTKVVAGTGLSGNWASGTITLSLSSTIPTKTSDLTNDSGFLTAHQDITGKEDVSNKVTTLSSSSTDTQYPSAKAVYDAIDAIPSGGGSSSEIFVGSTTPSGYTLYIDPDGMIENGEGVSF